jgi:tRNA(Ile)-lysidine synthase
MFCEDSSNLDLAVPRNQVRHRLLPVIEDIAPGGIAALARFAALATADEEYLEQAAMEAGAATTKGGEVQIWRTRSPPPLVKLDLDVETLRRMPPAVGRRVVRHALEMVGARGRFAASHVDGVRRLAAAVRPSGHLDLPGVKVERRGVALTLARSAVPPFRGSQVRAGEDGTPESRKPGSPEPTFEVLLPVPGIIDVPGAEVRLSARTAARATAEEISTGGDVAVLQASSVTLPLTVRSRLPGDRLRSLGAPGHRKLQDLLVDRKIPRHERDRMPIVVDATGRIVWVGGLAMAEECRVTAPGTGVVVLKVHRKGSLN